MRQEICLALGIQKTFCLPGETWFGAIKYIEKYISIGRCSILCVSAVNGCASEMTIVAA